MTEAVSELSNSPEGDTSLPVASATGLGVFNAQARRATHDRYIEELFPDVLWIVFNLMIGEHLQVLLLKCSRAMVFQLAVDICQHSLHFGATYGKCAIAVLPMELKARSSFFINVLAGVRLKLANKTTW